MKTKIIPIDKPNAYRHAVDVLINGGMVAFPTDTVYGLATLAFKDEFVDQLYIAKGRSHDKAIAILLSSMEQLDLVARDLNTTTLSLAKHFWPGPLTLIVPKHPNVPNAVSTLATIGVRIPNHPVALKLFDLAGPLAVTSANRSDASNTNSAGEVLEQLGSRIHMILDGGQTPGGIPSTVVDCTKLKPKILRKGPIARNEIYNVLKQIDILS